MSSRCLRDVTGLRDRALLLLVAALTQSGRRTGGDAGVTNEAGATEVAVPRRWAAPETVGLTLAEGKRMAAAT